MCSEWRPGSSRSNHSNVRCWLTGRKQLFRPPVTNEKRASVFGGWARKLAGSSGRPSTLTRWPSSTHLEICRKNVSGAGPNSPFVHSWVSGVSCSCVHSVGSPEPNMKLETLHTPLWHLRPETLQYAV